jgi:hypothetical protein
LFTDEKFFVDEYDHLLAPSLNHNVVARFYDLLY